LTVAQNSPAASFAVSRRPSAHDLVVCLAVAGAELGLLLDDGYASPAAVALTALASGAILERRRAPRLVLAATLAAAAAIVAVGEAPGGIAVLVAVYTTGLLCERRASLAALAPSVGVVVALSLLIGEGDGSTSSLLLGTVASVPATVGAWGLGAYAQMRRRYLHELEERAAWLEQEQEHLARIAVHEERAAIARELHDIVGHGVTMMLVGVRGARDVLARDPELARETLGRVETTAESSLAELRRILPLLRGADHRETGRPQPSLADLDRLVDEFRAAGMPVSLDLTGRPRPAPAGVELSIFRILQEALTNALRHAHPRTVDVRLHFGEERLDLVVVNDGAHGASEPGHGLLGMRQRVELLGGTLETGPEPGDGFRVAAHVPIR
jgi:signal transduction histidine kinase